MGRISQFLQEDNGNFSATRLAMLSWVVGVLASWAYLSISLRKMQDIPQSVVTIIGILVTGKVAQKFSEEKPGTAQIHQSLSLDAKGVNPPTLLPAQALANDALNAGPVQSRT